MNVYVVPVCVCVCIASGFTLSAVCTISPRQTSRSLSLSVFAVALQLYKMEKSQEAGSPMLRSLCMFVCVDCEATVNHMFTLLQVCCHPKGSYFLFFFPWCPLLM